MAKTILKEWIIIYEVPAVITTNIDTQFQSTILDTKYIRIITFYFRFNGLGERFHRKLKAFLTMKPNKTNLMDNLPLI